MTTSCGLEEAEIPATTRDHGRQSHVNEGNFGLAGLSDAALPALVGVHAVCSRTPAGYQIVRKDVLAG